MAGEFRVIGVRLITMHGIELEPTADIEWSLDIWKADGFGTKDDRVIGAGAVISANDPDFGCNRD